MEWIEPCASLACKAIEHRFNAAAVKSAASGASESHQFVMSTSTVATSAEQIVEVATRVSGIGSARGAAANVSMAIREGHRVVAAPTATPGEGEGHCYCNE